MTEFHEKLQAQAMAAIDRVSIREQQRGEYGVKAGPWALSQLREQVVGVEAGNSPGEVAMNIIERLHQFRRDWDDDAFADEYGAARGLMGSAIDEIYRTFQDYLD